MCLLCYQHLCLGFTSLAQRIALLALLLAISFCWMGVGPTSLGNTEVFPVLKPAVAVFFFVYLFSFILPGIYSTQSEGIMWLAIQGGPCSFLKSCGPRRWGVGIPFSGHCHYCARNVAFGCWDFVISIVGFAFTVA